MQSIEGIKLGLTNKDSYTVIARKLFLSYATEIFKNDEDSEFYIKNKISTQFNVPFSSIEIVGSSKTGLSFFKDKKFEPKTSDLDIAIISLSLFNKLSEMTHVMSKGYSDLTNFRFTKDFDSAYLFRKGLTGGFINPYNLPNSPFKSEWFDFFNSLSNEYFELFKSINAGIYASEYFFESKQEACIRQYIKNPGVYDKISS